MSAEHSTEVNVQLRHHREIANPYLEPKVASTLRSSLLTTGSRDEPHLDRGDMMLSARARTLIASAFAFAETEKVTPLHLFWAMLDQEQGEVADLLTAWSFTRDRIENDIRELASR